MLNFKGYAAVFNREDRSGDIVRPCAFPIIRPNILLLWQHQPHRPIGKFSIIRSDEYGLYVEGSIVHDTVESYMPMGLSFGYRVREALPGPPRELLNLELVEISVVTLPMQPLAIISEIWNAP